MNNELSRKFILVWAATESLEDILPFWLKARIPTKRKNHWIEKILKLNKSYCTIKKGRSRKSDAHRTRESIFVKEGDNLFDIAHEDALTLIKIEEDREFLLRQREPRHQGSIVGVEKEDQKKNDMIVSELSSAECSPVKNRQDSYQ